MSLPKKKKKTRSYPHLKIEKVENVEHRHPRAITQRTDIKTEEGILRIETSMDSEMSTSAIPRASNPQIEKIITPPFSLKRYKGQNSVLVSDKSGKWLGKLEKHDLKNLWFEIGAMLRRIKHDKR